MEANDKSVDELHHATVRVQLRTAYLVMATYTAWLLVALIFIARLAL
jgi:hypothetical protein